MTVGGGLALITGVGVASAQTPDEAIEALSGALDTAWLLIAATLVVFMQAGFAMVEAGFVRSKNVTNILMKNVMDACIGGLAYFLFGWGLAYGTSEAANAFVGSGDWALIGFEDYASWFFQFAFAATAATIVSGAMAERTKFSAYLIYTLAISGFIYPIVSHWIWDANGFLSALNESPMRGVGMIDFAGSTVVHSVGGWAALIGAIVVGARRGRFGDHNVGAIPGHSLPLGVLGVFILWVGWYGFNPGSTLGLSGGLAEIAARVAVTTTLAAAAGGAMSMVLSRMQYGKSDLSLTLNGILGGLVAITAGCATLPPWAAVLVGLIAGIIIVYGVALLDLLRIDDPVGAVPVHLMNGVWGTLAVGIFSAPALVENAFGLTDVGGILMGGGTDLLMVQLTGIASVAIWTVALSAVMFVGIKATMGLRVSAEEEDAGLDVYEHGMEAYPEFTGGRDPFSGVLESTTSR